MEPQFEEKQQKKEVRGQLNQIEIKVSDPQLDQSGGYTTYMISGHDKLGTFEIRRRYNDFFYFREALKKKWPGLYIPPIPEKKIIVTVM